MKELKFKCEEIFAEIEAQLAKDGQELIKKLKGVYAFKVKHDSSDEEVVWIVDCKNGNGSVEKNGKGKADCTIIINDSDLVKVMTGKLNPQSAFVQGKLKVSGNMGLALRLRQLQLTIFPSDTIKARL